MCDPFTAGILGAVGSIASAGINYFQQQDLISKQNAANAQWVAYQRQKSQEEWQRQDEARGRAEAARQQSLGDIAPEKQKEAQATEEQRLQKDYQPTPTLDQDPTLIGDKLLSGQKDSSEIVKGSIANQITQASRDARARIAALATMQSYGPSQFGLQNRAEDIFNKSAQDIRLQGDIRQGSLGAFGVEKGVQPQVFQASPSPWGGLASSLAGIAGRGLVPVSFNTQSK